MENSYGINQCLPKRKLLKLRKYASNGILVAALQKTAFKNITVCLVVRRAQFSESRAHQLDLLLDCGRLDLAVLLQQLHDGQLALLESAW